MEIKKIGISWLSASDFEHSKNFFTQTLGLEISLLDQKNGWLELRGKEGGSPLGIAQAQSDDSRTQPGKNAIVTLLVDDIAQAKNGLELRGVKFIGDILEFDYVKLAFFTDPDGNYLQLMQEL